MNNQLIQLDDLCIDLEKQQITRGQDTVPLPKLSYQLLVFFINNPSKTNSIDEIANSVWNDREVSNETVIQRIRLLRQGLGDDTKLPRYIKSVRGFGYQLIPSPFPIQIGHSAKQTDLEQSELSKGTEDQALDTKPSQSNTPSIALQVSILVGVILVIGSLVSFKMLVSQNSDNPTSQYKAAKSKNSQNSQDSQTNGSTILARADYYYRIGQQDDLLRAETFYRKALLQPEQQIRATIGLANTLSALVCRYSHSIELAKESEQLVKRLLTNPTLNNQARADAWAARGYAVDCLGNLKLALQSYIKAVELNPQDFSSRSSAAHLLEKSGQFINAIQWNFEVIDQTNENALTRLQLARNLELLGYIPQANKIHQQIFELYPDNVFINEAYPQFLFARGKLVEAQAIAQQAIERGIFRRDLYRLLGEISLKNRDINDALAWFEKSKSINPNTSYNRTIAEIYTNSLTQDDALKRVDQLNQAIESGDTWPDNFLELYLIHQRVLGDQTKAQDSLNRLANNGYLDIGYLQQSPFFEQVQQNEAFKQLIEQLQLKKQSLQQQLVQQAWLPSGLLD